MGSIDKMVQHAVSIAKNDYYGYSWADRWSHDRDCSSLMYDSADAAGYPVGRGTDKTRYTGTMIADFTAAGFTKYNYGSVSLQRGDILLRDPWGSEGHTEMYIGNGQLVGAHCSETGGVYGQPGDQTGNEISIGPLYGWWDYVLRPPDDLADAYRYLTSKMDASGRGKKVDARTRQDWMAAKQEAMQASIDALDKKLDTVLKALG